ncbi:MAG: helix-turn-helix transcriptional regulator [Chloroflexi bacterium]|nr:helix-turn-helix transcriptional regulator [Chloroflexota bacterium]
MHENNGPDQDLIPEDRLTVLTPREVEVLKLLGEGLTQEEIAGRLSVTKNTVKTHVHRIRGKLEVRSTRDAVRELRNKSPLRGDAERVN